MARDELLKPTLHVEVQLKASTAGQKVIWQLCQAVAFRLKENYSAVTVGQAVEGFDGITNAQLLDHAEIADYTGPLVRTGYYDLDNTELDVQAYVLKTESSCSPRRSISQAENTDVPQVRTLELPHATINEAWNSLVFDDALPARLLRYLVRMVSMMSQPGLNLSTFNWNRLCLLHGPPGSGKSTLCRALAQKLSIRLGNVFQRSVLVELNTNAMLSKYFGESGKLIGSVFAQIYSMAEERCTLVCVVMDEVETISGSRAKVNNGSECSDGLRATNQLLTALDRLRDLPNVIVICTSNLIDAIDTAFLDRVDIKQLIPAPSPAAVYKIFRSCLNELVRSSLVDGTARIEVPRTPPQSVNARQKPGTRANKRAKLNPPVNPTAANSSSSSPPPPAMENTIPTFSEMHVKYLTQPTSLAYRVWMLAQRCHGLSGRTLRRLPILGLAMYTWGGDCGLAEAVAALEEAVEQELAVVKREMGAERGM